MSTLFAIALVFVGCCSNVVFLELLVRDFPGCGNIVTFAQFAFIALEGFIFETNFGRKKPHIPLSNYVIMVTMFFTVSVINNYALNFNIAMPLHMIFRSGSLIANMILGIIILKKRYSSSKYLSIVLVSVGIFICTIMSAKQVCFISHSYAPNTSGIAMLTFALLMSARMGIFQETLYKKYGKHSKEALFYNHCLPLPGFILLSTDIYRHAMLFSQSSRFLRYVCIRGVFILTTECASLTVTLVVTLRKFLSLIISILYFQNPFTAWHWVGTAVVFLGTLLYTEVWSSIQRVIDRMKESPPVVCPQATTKPCTQSMTTPPVAPPVEQLVPEPVTPFVPLVPVTEKTSAPPSPVESPEALPASPAAQPASGKPVDLPVDPETSPSPISIPAPIQSVLEESAVSQSGSASSVVLPEEMPSKTQMGPISTGEPKVPHLSQVEEPVEASLIDQLKAFPPQTCVVNEEKLKNQIREDLQKNLLNEEMKTAERNIQQQLEEEKAKAKVQAQSAARLQIQDEVQKLLEEKALADAIRREQLNVQDERLIAQYYWMEKKAQKLEEMQKDLKNQDNVFREQIAKMQKKAK
ncbi:UDP-xylose and UDP-N-acetylglucosamine transporter [Labeo rohita]|uniref:Solute carrier family 35 member B4 n=1 Tax=Labeo rohita TaxID=84645 RepID=A0A498NT98_LABRO|nr:UDP-xylose and UDP-N-acetylglucosamine transporter [Labeo rohita]